MERTSLDTAGSRTRRIPSARCRGRRYRARLWAPTLAVLCLALVGAPRDGRAQRSATIQVTATVTSGYASAGIRPFAAPAHAVEPARHLQRVPVAGVGILEVEGAAGARVWLSAATPIDAGLRGAPTVRPADAGAGALPAAPGDVPSGTSGALVRATVAWPGL